MALVLTVFNRSRSMGALLLALGFLLLSLYDVNHYLLFDSTDLKDLALFYHHFSPLMTLIGPCIYLYVRFTLHDRERLWKTDLLHLIPLAVTTIDLIPYFLTPFNEKIAFAQHIRSDLNAVREPAYHLFLNHFTTGLIRSAISLLYFLQCGRMLLKYHQHRKQHPEVPKSQSNITFGWISLMIGLLTIISLNYVLLMFQIRDQKLEAALFDNSPFFLLILLFYFMLIFSLLFFPQILYGLPRASPIHKVDKVREPAVEDQKRDGSKPSEGLHEKEVQQEKTTDNVPGEDDPFRSLANGILSYIVDEKPYLRPDFSLTDISIELVAPRHHIQYCFSRIIGERFTDMRKRLRVEETKKLLPLHRELSIEGVGRSAGFASKTQFFSSFKELTGMNPTEYLRKLDEGEILP